MRRLGHLLKPVYGALRIVDAYPAEAKRPAEASAGEPDMARWATMPPAAITGSMIERVPA